MPEKINNRTVFTLLEVSRSIQKTIENRYRSSFWVKAEMNKLNLYPHSGHCYPDLIEKKDGRLLAQLRANLWRTDYEKINANFLEILKEPLKDGINILFTATIHFDPVHGLSLRILDIDPVFTLGELEREKQETITRLKKEGVYLKNKQLDLPMLVQRLAIISVETSKGYSDFLNIIDHNPWGYRYFHHLFPAFLHGENAVESIIRQLERIRKVSQHFDAVAIIRGGGSDAGLSCFNSYLLAQKVATFNLPVLTGIGHSTNETVVEMVAFKNNITPTDLADFLIQNFHRFALPLSENEKKIFAVATRKLADEKMKIAQSARMFKNIIAGNLSANRHQLAMLIHSVASLTRVLLASTRQLVFRLLYGLKKNTAIENEKTRLNTIFLKFSLAIPEFIQSNRKETEIKEKHIELLNPLNVLKRGYSITYFQNKLMTANSEIEEGESLETIFHDGKVISTFKSKLKNESK